MIPRWLKIACDDYWFRILLGAFVGSAIGVIIAHVWLWP
jgi:hypothetical protein